jgi:galactose mutarotase-like enzyme
MVKLQSQELAVVINSKGAELGSVKNYSGTEFIWQADKDIWPRHAPVLFPVVGRLKEDHFFYEGKKYSLPQHGFARDREFELVHSEKESCLFRLISDTAGKNTFPFDFVFDIGYSLKGNKLEVSYSVKNNSFGEMYFSVGAHPGFICPLSPTENFEDYYLEFEQDQLTFTSLQEGLLSKNYRELKLSDRKLFLKENMFDQDALILENNQVNKLSLCSSKTDHKITMECKDWHYFGIWSKKGCNKFICLEPWYGITDLIDSDQGLKNKKGIINLGVNREFACNYFIHFH